MTIVFHVGGPDFHPARQQAEKIVSLLGDEYSCHIVDGGQAFEHLDGCDLLVLMGLHWPGMEEAWAGNLIYHPLTPAQQGAFENYVGSGRPLLLHHGAIASYSDWPRFGELIGFSWVWGTTEHAPVDTYDVHILSSGHPVVAGVEDYSIVDELYYDLQIDPGLTFETHAEAIWQGQRLPMIFTAEGGRTVGAGCVVYLANGHDMDTFASPALMQIWLNTVHWLLGEES